MHIGRLSNACRIFDVQWSEKRSHNSTFSNTCYNGWGKENAEPEQRCTSSQTSVGKSLRNGWTDGALSEVVDNRDASVNWEDEWSALTRFVRLPMLSERM